MAHAVRERIPELAVLKTLGFTDGSVFALVLAESISIVLIGGVLGMALAWAAVGGLAQAVSAYLPGLFIPGEALGRALLYIVLVGLVAGLFPALQARRLTIIEALGGHR